MGPDPKVLGRANRRKQGHTSPNSSDCGRNTLAVYPRRGESGESVPPESYTLDTALLERPGNKEIQLDLFLDYASNVKLYPKFQEYFRKSKPPLLAIWGKNDPFFVPAGAEAFRKDLPNAEVQFLDTGHFAIETHVVEIAAAMKDFFAANGVGRLKAERTA